MQNFVALSEYMNFTIRYVFSLLQIYLVPYCKLSWESNILWNPDCWKNGPRLPICCKSKCCNFQHTDFWVIRWEILRLFFWSFLWSEFICLFLLFSKTFLSFHNLLKTCPYSSITSTFSFSSFCRKYRVKMQIWKFWAQISFHSTAVSFKVGKT